MYFLDIPEDPLEYGECLHENEYFNLANYMNQNKIYLVWARRQSGMRENFYSAFSLI